MGEKTYAAHQEETFRDHESLCGRCGKCCGSEDGDPCSKLKKDVAGNFFCLEYDLRLGLQKTISGKYFTCVTVRELMKYDALRPGCAYKE